MNLKHVAVGALCCAMAGCAPLSSPETSLSSQYQMYLTGCILDKDGNPKANTVVELKGRNLRDTTDDEGRYCFSERRCDHQRPSDTEEDSLVLVNNGEVIPLVTITDLIDSLPDFFLVQRDIYGDLTAEPNSFSRMTVTISSDLQPDAAPRVAEIWYNELNQSYSGLFYFIYTVTSVNYSVFISVYGADSSLIGRSVTVTFPRFAGDIHVPYFDPNNKCPGNNDAPGPEPIPVPVPVDTGSIVGWYHCDEGSGSVLVDAGPYKNDAVLHNATWTTGVSDKAVVFDGTPSCYGEVLQAAAGSLDFGTGDFSMELWYKTTASSYGDDHTKHHFLCKGDPYNTGFNAGMMDDRPVGWVGASTRYVINLSAPPTNDGVWHHVVCVRKSGVVSLYSDGVLNFSYTMAVNVNVSSNLVFGKHGIKNEGYYNGAVDEIILYRRALSPEEIAVNRARYNR
jgi:hypothetical protein